MTLDEAIEHAEEVATTRCGECAEEHKQLADWLRELKRARMKIDLLKILRDGFKADAQKYKAENEKLRELVRDMWHDGMCDCDEFRACAHGEYHCAECEYHYPDRMHELGIEIEVDDD